MLSLPNPDRNWGCRVEDRLIWSGYQAVMLQNELLQIVVLPDKGTEIIQFLYKPQDIDFLWRSANPLRDPRYFKPTGGTQDTAFFDRWSGGWFEVIPNGGPATEYKGAQMGFFAETINIPWHYRVVEDTPEQISVVFWVKTYRTPFVIQKKLTLKTGKAALFIEETITNEGREPVDFMWGHHPVIGTPFLDGSCRISAPKNLVEVLHAEDGPDHRMGLHQVAEWPIIKDRDGNPLDLRIVPPPENRTMDNCYLRDFQEGWISVQNQNMNLGFGLIWDPAVFRYLWIWQALGGGIGYPWYGRTYCMGLEPWSSYPCAGLSQAIENGTALQLQAGETKTAWLTAVAFPGNGDVSHMDRDGQVMLAENTENPV